MKPTSVLDEEWTALGSADVDEPTLHLRGAPAPSNGCISIWWWPLPGQGKTEALARRDLAALAPRMARFVRSLGPKLLGPGQPSLEMLVELVALQGALDEIETRSSTAAPERLDAPVVASKTATIRTATGTATMPSKAIKCSAGTLWVVELPNASPLDPAMTLLVITQPHPGGLYVVRQHSFGQEFHFCRLQPIAHAHTLEEARGAVAEHAPSLCRMEKRSDDHPSVVEAWGERSAVDRLTEARVFLGEPQ